MIMMMMMMLMMVVMTVVMMVVMTMMIIILAAYIQKYKYTGTNYCDEGIDGRIYTYIYTSCVHKCPHVYGEV